MVYSTLQRYYFSKLNEPYVKLIQIMENHADFSNILNKNLGGIKRYDKD